MRAYLAGAIEHAPDGGKEWRKQMTSLLESSIGHQVYDPTSEEVQVLEPEESQNFRKLKSKDLSGFRKIITRILDHDIYTLTQKIDYVVCLWDNYVKDGGGTQGELTLAYYHNIPVYLVTEIPTSEISSWILGCTTEIFDSFQSLETFLVRKYDNNSEKAYDN
jgi:hypothetical protein